MSATITHPSGQPGPMQPGDFESAGQPNVVTWNMKRLAPPSPLYVTVDDALVAGVASSQSNEVVTIAYRLLRAADAKPVVLEFTVAPGSNRTIKVEKRQLTEGFLLSVSCKAAVATTRGQTFVRLFLNPSAAGAGQPGLMMMADYVTTAMAPGYPNGRTVTPVEGPGARKGVQNAAPGIGLNWIVNVPVNARWRIDTLSAALTTDATAGNRTVQMVFTVGGLFNTYAFPAEAVVAPSSVMNYQFSKTRTVSPAVNFSWGALPEGVVLLGGDFIGVNVGNMGLGDIWGFQNLAVEEWLDNV